MGTPARRRPGAIGRTLLAAGAGVTLLVAASVRPAAEGDHPPAYQEAPVAAGVTLSGVVKGPPLAIPPKDAIVTKDQSVCGERKASEALIRGADGALKNAVVFLEGIRQGKPIDRSVTLRFGNQGCAFVPHVLALAVGQRIEIANGDPILHNTHAYLEGTQTVFNVALPIQNQRVPKTIKKPGLMRVQCDAGHGWMVAWIYAFEHPYFAVTDEKGSFHIDQIPPGTYRVTAWQEELGRETQEITIGAGQAPTISFEHLAK